MMSDLSQDFSRNGAVEVQGENGVFYPAYIYGIIEPSQLSQPQDCQLSSSNNNANSQQQQQINDQSMCFGSINGSGQQSGSGGGAESNTIISSNTNETHVIVIFQNYFYRRSLFPISLFPLEMEVFSSSSDQPRGWFRAIVKMIKGCFYKLFNILFDNEIRKKPDGKKVFKILNLFLTNNIDIGFVSPQASLVYNTPNTGSGLSSPIQPFRQIGAAAGGGSSGANLSNPHIYRPLDSSSVIFGTESNGTVSLSLNNVNVREAEQLQIIYKFGQIGTEPGCLNTPHGFCLGVNDDIVIADTKNHRICVFAFNGRFKFSFGEYGNEPGKLNQPRKIAMLPPAILRPEDPKPVFIVCDRGAKRSRMQIFSLDGNYIRLIDMPQMGIVSGFTTTQDRCIIVVDSVFFCLIVMDEFGGLLNFFTFSQYMVEPSHVEFHKKHFYICDFKGHNICVFNTHGVLVRRFSTNQYPNGIDISDTGNILCCDSHGNRFHISVFNQQGQLLGNFECPYINVSRCCGLRLSTGGFIVTLAKNNNHAVVFNSISVRATITTTIINNGDMRGGHLDGAGGRRNGDRAQRDYLPPREDRRPFIGGGPTYTHLPCLPLERPRRCPRSFGSGTCGGGNFSKDNSPTESGSIRQDRADGMPSSNSNPNNEQIQQPQQGQTPQSSAKSHSHRGSGGHGRDQPHRQQRNSSHCNQRMSCGGRSHEIGKGGDEHHSNMKQKMNGVRSFLSDNSQPLNNNNAANGSNVDGATNITDMETTNGDMPDVVVNDNDSSPIQQQTSIINGD
ncbi:hypothetical protein DERF_009823 [Dermatophagoides farinae]|uniref:Uncharacterized protein n=1 Tax=Dermatophagoides farinae TaxID=6954 RepID=A0A922HUP5_DERFA|nr:hypothetical protein DERF_009823 [Dermatophagoides farinae]